MIVNRRAINVVAFVFLWLAFINAQAADQSIPLKISSLEAENSSLLIALGKEIYRHGRLPNGKLITAVVQGDITLAPSQIICVSCHRRSGLGASEGDIQVPAITGDILRRPGGEQRRELSRERAPGPGARPAYDDTALKKVLSEGVDPAGRQLNPLMPKYNLDEEAMRALIAYLDSLNAEPSPGVTNQTLHVATIVTPDVDTQSTHSMLATLDTYIRDLNANTRAETQRARFAPWHKRWQYEAYKSWQLHVWRLHGTADSWQEQLEAFYADQPVFAVINGISDRQWAPIHQFCNKQELACIFPTTQLPVIDEEAFYSVYFSQGIALEAKALAKHIAALPGKKTVVQIYHPDQRGNAAAQALVEALEQTDVNAVRSIALDHDDSVATLDISSLMPYTGNLQLVLWIDANEVQVVNRSLSKKGVKGTTYYLSASFIGNDPYNAKFELPGNLYVVQQTTLQEHWDKHLARAVLWAKMRKVEYTSTDVMANAYYAVITAADAVRHMRGNLTREYFIEKIEHAVENSLFPSVYPHLSLAPGQRFAAKGCYIIGPILHAGRAELAKNRWIIP